jgi:galactokinase
VPIADSTLNGGLPPDPLRRARAGFERRFGRPPTAGATAPGRVNLIGGHTDYNEGFVLPVAIERRAAVVAAPAAASRSRLVALDLDASIEVDPAAPIEPRPDAPWADHVLGVARGLADLGAAPPALDVALASDVPIGAGLSSSAAIEVATATLLAHVTATRLDPVALARLCRRAETEFVGTPCGIMDMLVAVAARPGHALLIDCRTEEVEAIPLPPPDAVTLLAVDTGVPRRLANEAYADRRAACERAARRLGVTALRDATPAMVTAAGDAHAEDLRRATHVVHENERTLRAAERLRVGDVRGLGALMLESHASLRTLFDVSCPELDVVVDVARDLRADGSGPVHGARMTGAGFGGCAVVLCAAPAAPRVAARITEGFRRAFGRDPAVLRTGAAGPAAPAP